MKIAQTTLLILSTAGAAIAAEAKVVSTVINGTPESPGSAIITIVYTNTGTGPTAIRNVDVPRTGTDGKLRGDLLLVKGIDGSIPRYTGYHVGMTREAATRTLTLVPGESLHRTIDVSNNYELRDGMTYDVTPSSFRQKDSTSAKELADLNSYSLTNSPSIRISTLKARPTTSSSEPNARVPTISSQACSPEKVTAVAEGMAASAKLARDTKAYLASLYTREAIDGEIKVSFKQSPRYTSWFGIHGDPAIANPINSRIQKVIDSTADRFGLLAPASCKCTDEDEAEGTTAWVYADSNHVINYCPAFFKLPVGPNISAGSRAATIYHEATHFTDFLMKGTSDLDQKFNTPDDARYLAINARDLAADHGYSFEYFADNLSSEE